ncbi:MAG TPA: flippase-like domain-containing protein, partial [Candidatus Lokiarchaeia archaeon]
FFYAFITPGGFGAYIRSIYLSEESGAPLPKCVSNIIIYNIIEFIGMLILGAIAAIFLTSVYPYLFYIIILILLCVIFLFLFFFKNKKSKVLFTKIVKSRIFSTVKDRIEGSIESFFEDLPKFKDVLLPFAISIIGWFVKYILLFFVAKLFSIEVPILYFMMVIAVSDVIASIPISIYGIGTREMAFITMFGLLDISREKIVSFSLFLFVILWLTPSVIGAFVTAYETRRLKNIIIDDKIVERFSNYIKKYPDVYRYLADIVKKNISNKISKPVVLDLGSGPGLLSLEISKQLTNSTVIDIDPSDKMLNFAKKNVKYNGFHTLLGKSENIPLKNDTIDVVVTRFSLPYWKKPMNSFKDIYRVLKPDGKFVIEELNRDFPKFKLFLINIHMFFKSAGFDLIRYHSDAYKTAYKIQDLETLLEKVGFKIIYREAKDKDWKYIIVAEK